MRDKQNLPAAVILAQGIDWNVFIDAYLMDAAKVGARFAAKAYEDGSGLIENGATVATPPVTVIAEKGELKLLKSVEGSDHYVIVSELQS